VCHFIKYVHRLLGSLISLGEVVEGLDVVKAAEALGSADGKTKKTVTIARSGTI
jgi:peptidylprolyl isomerase